MIKVPENSVSGKGSLHGLKITGCLLIKFSHALSSFLSYTWRELVSSLESPLTSDINPISTVGLNSWNRD